MALGATAKGKAMPDRAAPARAPEEPPQEESASSYYYSSYNSSQGNKARRPWSPVKDGAPRQGGNNTAKAHSLISDGRAWTP